MLITFGASRINIEGQESNARVPILVESAVRTGTGPDALRTADPTKAVRLACITFLTLNNS